MYAKLGQALAEGNAKATLEVIWGGQDKTVPFSQRSLMQQLLPTATFTDLPSAGHADPFAIPAMMDTVCQRVLDHTKRD